MKNISPLVLPNFYGMPIEEPNSFPFDFDILCQSCNYVNDAQKFKLFPIVECFHSIEITDYFLKDLYHL